jgi:hypothetical protein
LTCDIGGGAAHSCLPYKHVAPATPHHDQGTARRGSPEIRTAHEIHNTDQGTGRGARAASPPSRPLQARTKPILTWPPCLGRMCMSVFVSSQGPSGSPSVGLGPGNSNDQSVHATRPVPISIPKKKKKKNPDTSECKIGYFRIRHRGAGAGPTLASLKGPRELQIAP